MMYIQKLHNILEVSLFDSKVGEVGGVKGDNEIYYDS